MNMSISFRTESPFDLNCIMHSCNCDSNYDATLRHASKKTIFNIFRGDSGKEFGGGYWGAEGDGDCVSE